MKRHDVNLAFTMWGESARRARPARPPQVCTIACRTASNTDLFAPEPGAAPAP